MFSGVYGPSSGFSAMTMSSCVAPSNWRFGGGKPGVSRSLTTGIRYWLQAGWARGAVRSHWQAVSAHSGPSPSGHVIAVPYGPSKRSSVPVSSAIAALPSLLLVPVRFGEDGVQDPPGLAPRPDGERDEGDACAGEEPCERAHDGSPR